MNDSTECDTVVPGAQPRRLAVTTLGPVPRPAPLAALAREAGSPPWVPVDGVAGARVRTLWESPSARAVVLRLERGATIPLHVHPDEEHHAFVLAGWCAVGEHLLTEGSAMRVAAGEPHEVRGEFPFGATILYVFERGAS